MSKFDELMARREQGNGKEKTPFESLEEERKQRKAQQKAAEYLKHDDLSDISNAIKRGVYLDPKTVGRYKYRVSEYIDNYNKLDSRNDDGAKELTDFQTSLDDYGKYMSQFKSQEDYDKYVEKKARQTAVREEWGEVSSDPFAAYHWQQNYNSETARAADDRLDEYNKIIKKIDDLDARIKTATGEEKDTFVKWREGLLLKKTQYERFGKKMDEYGTLADDPDFYRLSNQRNFESPAADEIREDDVRANYDMWYDVAPGGNIQNAYGEWVMKDGKPVEENGYYINDKGEILFKRREYGDKLGAYKALSASDDPELTTDNMGGVGAVPYKEQVLMEGMNNGWDYLEPGEEAVYYYLLNQNGKEAADKYLDDMTIILTKRRSEALAQGIQDNYNEANLLGRIAMSAATVPANLFGGIANTMDKLGSFLNDEEYNPYSTGSMLTDYANVTRATRAKSIDDTIGFKSPILGITFGDTYQAIMSGLDSIAGAGAFGRGYTSIMGTGAGLQEARELYEAGASDEQVALGGITAGVAEALFEYVSLDHFLKTTSTKSGWQLVKQIFSQAGVEASEEMCTDVSNIITNALIMRSQSDWQKLMDEGGFGKAFGESVKEVFKSGYGGLVSGGLMAAGGSSANLLAYNIDAKSSGTDIYNSGKAGVLVDTANKTDDLSKETNKYKKRTENALAKNSNDLTGKDYRVIGKFSDNLDTDLYEQAYKTQIRNHLAENNIDIDDKTVDKVYKYMTSNAQLKVASKDVRTIAKKLLQDESFTRFEHKVNDQYNSKVRKINKEHVRRIYTGIAKSNTTRVVHDAVDAYMEDVDFEQIAGKDGNTADVRNKTYMVVEKIIDGKPLTATEKKLAEQTGAAEVAEEVKNDVLVKNAKSIERTAAPNVSDDGKTRLADTGEEVKIAGIKTVGQNKVYVTENGKTIDPDNIAFGSDEEAAVYLTALDLGLNDKASAKLIDTFKNSRVDADTLTRQTSLAYMYGVTGEQSMLNQLSDIPEDLRDALYFNGREESARRSAALTTDAKQNGVARKTSGKIIYENDIDVDAIKEGTTQADANKRLTIAEAEVYARLSPINIHLYESYGKEGSESRFYNIGKGEQEGAPNGWFRTGTNDIYIDINSGDHGEGFGYLTLGHEIGHYIRYWNANGWSTLADAVAEEIDNQYRLGKVNRSFQDMVDKKIEHYETLRSQRVGKYATMDDADIHDEAYEDTICDAIGSLMTDAKTFTEFTDNLKAQSQTLWQKFKEAIDKFLKRIDEIISAMDNKVAVEKAPADALRKSLAETRDNLRTLYNQAFMGANENVEAAIERSPVQVLESITDTSSEITTEAATTEEFTKESYRSLAEACGFDAYEDPNTGVRYWRFKNTPYNVEKITTEQIRNSPVGALIAYAAEGKQGYISNEEAEAQLKMFANIGNMCISQQDFAQAMQFVGSSIFTAMKSNADKQYGTTYDFPSICTKTQAVIDHMSDAMMKKHAGLTKTEIEAIYRNVHELGNPVPCPECYVFSRWIGIGGLLDNIKRYQTKYSRMSVEEVKAEYAQKYAEIGRFAKDNRLTPGKAKGKLASKFTKEYNKLSKNIADAEAKGDPVTDAQRKKLALLESQIETVKAMTWIDTVYFADSLHTKVNKNYIVPDEVLFNLNDGETFATKYREAWAFRTTQGAGYGKAITPYAEAVLGEGITVTNNTTKAIKAKNTRTNLDQRHGNIFLEQNGSLSKEARTVLETARKKQLAQAFIGGQRLQSTSDARYENASDYLIAAIELQAMHGMAQVYTKVSGAVEGFANWGYSINQSLMPKNNGLNKDGTLSDTDVGGMSTKVAFANRLKYESAGTITIGVNDRHIRTLMNSLERDFIIPYHASGGDANLIAEFRRIQESKSGKAIEVSVQSSDYSKVQSEKELDNDVLARLGYSDEEIADVIKFREQRLAILTGKGRIDQKYIRAEGNEVLAKLYDEFHGGRWNGVTIAKGKCATQIYPNEYWDRSLTYDESSKITEDYLEYCRRLGFLHKFSGKTIRYNKSLGYKELVPVNGYDENGNKVALSDLAYIDGNESNGVEPYFWKTLTDRRMYDNDGNYLEQKFVTLGDTNPDIVTNFAKKNEGSKVEYSKKKSEAGKKTITIKNGEVKINSPAKFSERDTSYAPTFYSHMGKVVDEIKPVKMGAGGVVSYLKGKGVKNEELKWSGIEAFLEGKKSVTKQELQEFVAGSMLQIEEQVTEENGDYVDTSRENYNELKEKWTSEHSGAYIDNTGESYDEYDDWEYDVRYGAESKGYEWRDADIDDWGDYISISFDGEEYARLNITDNAFPSYEEWLDDIRHGNALDEKNTRWSDYKLDGGTNYRELLFKLPNSNYTNDAMKTHWGEEAGVLAHARMQDMKTADGMRMLFVEEIQSDWHNAGKKNGYLPADSDIEQMQRDVTSKRKALRDLEDRIDNYLQSEGKKIVSAYQYAMDRRTENEVIGELITIAPHNFARISSVFDKELLASKEIEEYKSFNEERSKLIDELDSLYDELYDEKRVPDAPFKDTYTDFVMKRLIRMAAEEGYDCIGWTTAQQQSDRWSDEYAEGYRIEYDQDIPKFLNKYGKKWGAKVGESHIFGGWDSAGNGANVWSFPITEAMQESVLNEGQAMYSLREVDPVQPTSDNWQRGVSTAEAMKVYPDLWNVSAEESETRNPTQITSTVKTYRKIYDILDKEGFDGKILDASSGLGYGTRAGIDEYGFDVDDIEPYPSQDYKPKYTDYSTLDEKYDAIISNAVLNVLPQEQRDALVVKMGDMLNNGGRMFINVRSLAEIQALQKAVDKKTGKLKNIKLSDSEVAETTKGSYQKGFTKAELKAYLEDALGDGYTVTPTTAFGGVSVIVEKIGTSQRLMSERGTDSISNRALLTNALDGIITNPGERNALEAYRSAIDILDKQQTKLDTVRKQIHEIMFTAGADRSGLAELQAKKAKLEKAINAQDKKILNFESTKMLKNVLEREKAKAVKKAKGKVKSKYTEAANVRKYKNGIRKIRADFVRRINNATELSYVPAELANSIIDVCAAIDVTGRDQSTRTAEKYRSGRQALLELKHEYDKLNDDKTDYELRSEYDAEVSYQIGQLADTIKDTPMRDMTPTQLEDTYIILRDLQYALQDATKQIGTAERISNYEAGTEVIEEMNRMLDEGLTTNEVSKFFRNYLTNPMRAVREMTGYDENSRLRKLFDALNQGRRDADTFTMKATKEFDALRSTKEGRKAFNEAVEKPFDFGLTDINGNSLKISKMQAMQILLTYYREISNKNRNHLDTGVLVPDVDLQRKGQYDKALEKAQFTGPVGVDFIHKILANLSDWDMQYMKTAQQFFNTTARDAINKVSMQTKHRIIATEKDYIPYEVDKDYVYRESENLKIDKTLAGWGNLKSVTPNAKQRLVIAGLNQVASKHINGVAKQVGLAVPVRNWNKVFNMKQTFLDGDQSVKSAIKDTWGKAGQELLDQAVADLQGTRPGKRPKILNMIKSGQVASTLAFNISVWMKQAASYPTAGSILSIKALAKGLADYSTKIGKGIHAQDVWDEIDEHTSQHWIRRKGLSLQELGEINQSKGWVNFVNSKLGKYSPMNWIQSMDVGTTAALWYACKAEVESDGLHEGVDGYWERVTELYDKVIEDTQPMYDSLHRAEITKIDSLKNIVMFKTQPLQNSGILREATEKWRVNAKRYGAKSEQAKTAGKAFGKAVASQLASHFVFTAMTLLSAALLHKMNPYRDEDEDLTLESILKGFGSDWASSAFGAAVPVFGEIGISVAEKIVGNNRYDVLTDFTVDRINSIFAALDGLKQPSWKSFKKAGGEIASLFGIPASNGMNIIDGAIMHVQDAIDGQFLSYETGVERTGTQQIHRAYVKYMEGDTQTAIEYLTAFGEEKGDKARSAFTRQIKPIYVEAIINNDEETAKKIRLMMADSGYYGTKDEVVKTCQKWVKDSTK